eukprot:g2031.t1
MAATAEPEATAQWKEDLLVELLDRISSGYVRLMQSVTNVVHRGNFFRFYPFALAEAVYQGIRFLCPGSRPAAKDLRQLIHMELAVLLSGVDICAVSILRMHGALFASAATDREDAKMIDSKGDFAALLASQHRGGGSIRIGGGGGGGGGGGSSVAGGSITGSSMAGGSLVSRGTASAAILPALSGGGGGGGGGSAMDHSGRGGSGGLAHAASMPALQGGGGGGGGGGASDATISEILASGMPGQRGGGLLAAMRAGWQPKTDEDKREARIVTRETLRKFLRRRDQIIAGTAGQRHRPTRMRQPRVKFAASCVSPLVNHSLGREQGSTVASAGGEARLSRTMPVSWCKVGGRDTFRQSDAQKSVVTRARAFNHIVATNRNEYKKSVSKFRQKIAGDLAGIETKKAAVNRGGLSKTSQFVLEVMDDINRRTRTARPQS